MPFVSIIIPVFNKKNRIAKTLESVFSQTFRNYELLVIDDGSTDGSSEIIDNTVKKQQNIDIKVIHQANGGVSCARNRGIKLAEGLYLCFIDADDTLAPLFLENLVNKLNISEADIISESKTTSKSWKGDDIVNYIDTEGRTVQGTTVYNKLYKSDLIKNNGLSFDTSLRFGEDTEFNLTLWPLCNEIITVQSSNYNIFVEEGKTWELTAQEIKNKIHNLKEKYGAINKKFNRKLSIERDINITLSLYPTDKILEDSKEYIKLYKEIYPEADKNIILNNSRCSPVFKGISAAKMNIVINPEYSYQTLKKLRKIYKKELLKLRYPYLSFKLCGLALYFGGSKAACKFLKFRN